MEQRRQRRAAAGRSGGEFELLRQGDRFTFRYASPDPRRHEPQGEYSWAQTMSTDELNHIDASIRSQGQAESTPNTNPLLSASTDSPRSPSGAFNEILVEPNEQTPVRGNFRYHAYAESIYSRDSSGEEVRETSNSRTISHNVSEEIPSGATSRMSFVVQREQAFPIESSGMAEIRHRGEDMLGGANLRSPAKKKSFASMKSVKRLGTKIVQRGNGAKTVQKMRQWFKLAVHGKKSAITEPENRMLDDRSGLDSRRQEASYNPTAPETRIIKPKSDSPVKEQLLRENDHDLPHEALDKDFFTPPAGSKKSNKEVKVSPDSEVFD